LEQLHQFQKLLSHKEVHKNVESDLTIKEEYLNDLRKSLAFNKPSRSFSHSMDRSLDPLISTIKKNPYYGHVNQILKIRFKKYFQEPKISTTIM
jgi:hypothetical protein